MLFNNYPFQRKISPIRSICRINKFFIRDAFLLNSQIEKKCYSNLVVKILYKLKDNVILLNITRFYFCLLYFLRSIFTYESFWTMPCLGLVIEVMHYSAFTNIPHQTFYILTGFYLLIYDNLGSYFSQIFDKDSFLATTYLVLPFSNKPLRNFFSIKAFVLGKTVMSSTGRASIIVGASVLGGTILNSYLDRRALDQRAVADRQAQDQRAAADRYAQDQRAAADRYAQDQRDAKARAYQNFQNAKKEYNSTSFYKKNKHKPIWDESHWETWSKSE